MLARHVDAVGVERFRYIGSRPHESMPPPGGPAHSHTTARRDQDVLFDHTTARHGASGPLGFIGSRPREESSSGDGASAAPEFQDLVLAGRQSGTAERSLVEEAPGVRVELVTFGNGTRVFAETYVSPVAALEQVLQRKVAAIMDAPVGRTCLILEDDTVYREITAGQPGDSVQALDRAILGSRSAERLGLFDAVTRTNRTAREWNVGPDNEVRGGRAPSTIDATPTGAFAATFVRHIDGREVWQHHGMPRSELSAIREQVAYLQSWISDLPVPRENKLALHHIHGRYMDALAEVEWRAVRTQGENSHRAGLDVEAQTKARLVEAFTLDYPHITIVGFDHPDVPAHVVAEILGGLDEMLTRFPGRTNIRGLWIDYLGEENAGAASFAQRDSESTFRTLGIQFSLRNASRPAWTVERGIEMRERGFNPVGDRPFHHDAVHEFVHAIDAVELLSVPLPQVLHDIWSRLDELELIREPEHIWLARLPAYAFVDQTKAELRPYEALAVGFAEMDIHGAAIGTPQWAIHQYVTAGRPPQIIPDLAVDLSAQGDRASSVSEQANDADLTRPSRAPDSGAMPSGPEAVVRVHGAGHEPPGFRQEQRGLRRQNEAAVVLARAGFQVEQHPVEPGARLPDFRIEGRIFDCYSPATGKVSNICFEIRRKVLVKRQAERIVVNLADSTADPVELSLALRRHPIPGLREILAIDRHGTVLRLLPGPATVIGNRPDTGDHEFIGSRPSQRPPEPPDSQPDSVFANDVRLLNEAVRDGRGPLRGEHFPLPGLRMRSNDPGRNAALRMFSLWQAHVANRGLGKLVSRWDAVPTPASRRRVLAQLYFWISHQRYMRQVWAVERDPSVVGEHGESHPDYFRTRLGDDAPNMDMVGRHDGMRAGARRDPGTGKWHGGVGTPAFWTMLAIGRLVRSRMDVEAPGSTVLQNVVELPGGARVEGNVLSALERGRFAIETARAGDQRTIFDAAMTELAAALDQRSPQPSPEVLRRVANAVYLLFQAPLMTRGSDATIRTFAATVFAFAFGRPLRLPHDIDLQAMSRRQSDFVEWFAGSLERGLRTTGESDAAGRPDARSGTEEDDRPPTFIGSRPREQSDPSLDAARGAWLKALRLEQGMKQKDVAKAADLTNAALSNIENGRRTSLGTFQQVCRALGIEGEALTEATRRFYPEVELDTDAAAHDSPGGWVAAHRNSRGMTKTDLARAVGVTPTRIGEIEDGDRPQPNVFYRIARALGVDPQALAEATRSLYPDLVLDLDPAAHDPATPGNWIVALRHDRDRTQAEVARAAGTSAGYLAGIEGGKYTPSSIIFRRICRALEVGSALLATATHHFYPDLELGLDPRTHDSASPGSWIVALRHDRDMTGNELTDAIGPGWGHLSGIETGNYVPRFAVFRRICEVLGTDDELLRMAIRHFYPHVDLDLESAAHDLGRWITALRYDRDMSRAELARATGLSTKYLAQVETGNRRPRYSTFRQICRALGVSGGLLIQAARDFYSDITVDIDPASHKSLGRWIAALRYDEGMSVTELARRARMPRSTLSSIENNRYLPRLSKLRQLCRTLGIGGDMLLEAVDRFYGERYERSGYREEEKLFQRYVVTRVGSREERVVQDEILEKFAWVPNAVARRESPDIREEATHVARIATLTAIKSHIPSASFAAHAWASCRGALFRFRLERIFPNLDDRTRKMVSTVGAQIGRMVAEGEVLDDAAIARAVRMTVADVTLAREILDQPTRWVDEPMIGKSGPLRREIADPSGAGFADTDFAMTVRSALADLADPAMAQRLVMLHLVEGMSLARSAERLGLGTAAASELLADTVARLRNAFDDHEPADVTASEQTRPTPWSAAREQPDQPPGPPVSRGDSAPGEGTTRPGGFIGSRPPEPGESARGPASEQTPGTTPWSRLSDRDANEGVGGERETVGATESRAVPEYGSLGSRPTDSSDSEPPASASQERPAPVASAAWPPPDGAQPFRHWLKAARLGRGLTQAVLAARMGVPNSATYIGSLERGVTITRDMAVRLLAGLDAPDEVAEAVLREYFPEEGGEFPDPRSDRFRHPKDWIIAARTSKGLSRAELAARAGVGLTGLGQKERAQHPRGESGIRPDYALRLLAGLAAPSDIVTAFIGRFYPGWDADERGNTGPEGFIGNRPRDDAPEGPVPAGEPVRAEADTPADFIGPVDARAGLPTYTPPDAETRMRADRVLREHWGAGASPDDLVYRWRRSTAKRAVTAAEECAEHTARNTRRARNLTVDEVRALVRVWPEFVGAAGGFPSGVRDQANRWAFAKTRAVLERAAVTTRLSGRQRALREYLLNVEDLLIRARQRAATVETPGVPMPTVLLERFDTGDPSGGSIMISFGSGDPVAEAWHVDGTDRDLRRLDQRMQLACNHYEAAVRENPERPVRVVVWSGTDGHRLAGDLAAPHPAVRPERQLVVHGDGGRPAKKALAHEWVARTTDAVVVCGESNLGAMREALAGIALSTDVYYGIDSRAGTAGKASNLPGVQFASRFPTGDAGRTNAVLKDVRDMAQRYEKEPFEEGKPIDDEFLLYVDDRTKAPTESLENIGRILAGCPDRVARHNPMQDGRVRFTECIERAVDEQTRSVYADILPRNPDSGMPTLRETGSDAALARSAIDKRGGPGAGPEVLLHRGLPDDFTRAGRLAIDNKRWWNSLHRDEQRAVVAVHPRMVGNAPGLPSEVANYANDYRRYATASAIRAKGRKNASRTERQIFRNLYAVGEALTRSVTVHRDIPAPVVTTVALDPEAFGGNGSGTFVIGNCRLEDAEHVIWYVDGVNTRLQSAPTRLASARNLYEELVRADPSTKVAVVCWIGYEAPSNNKEAWASRPELAEAGGRLFARDVLAWRAVTGARMSKLGYSYGTPVVAEGGVGGRLDGVFEHGVVMGSPGRGRRFDSATDASCRSTWVLAQSDDPVTGFGGDAPDARGRLLGDGPFGLGTDPATDTIATRVRAERGFPYSLAPFDGHGEYLQYSLVGAAQPTESLRHAAWCLAGRGDEVPTERHRPTVENPTAMHRIRARVVDAARDRRAPQLDAALAAPGDHRSRRDLSGPPAGVASEGDSVRSGPVRAAGAAVGPSDATRAGPRLAVRLGKG
ncbi:helix-turn-helix domain-containing protein, partial [Nocardia barduliensis]|uniref:helix-turn-helix domain-containing protein n=1 Tax=Nocardia barduliensis TaxID=2736643 RepID=UPI0015718FB1